MIVPNLAKCYLELEKIRADNTTLQNRPMLTLSTQVNKELEEKNKVFYDIIGNFILSNIKGKR